MADEARPFEGLVVGRIVHYWPNSSEGQQARVPGPWAAIVTQVPSPVPDTGEITLNIQIPMPVAIGVDPVQRRERVPYNDNRENGTWCWMFEGQGTRYRSNPPSALPRLEPRSKPPIEKA